MKKQLKAISKSAATGHPKIAIASLCAVIQALVLEIEKIQSPKITLLSTEQTVPINTPPKARPQEEETERPMRTPPLNRPNRTRPFNAGDAE